MPVKLNIIPLNSSPEACVLQTLWLELPERGTLTGCELVSVEGVLRSPPASWLALSLAQKI